MVSFPKVIAWWVTKLLSPFLLSPSLFPGIFIQLLSFFYSAPVWRWMGASSVSGSHHCWIRISWLCWNTEVVPKGKPVLCRAWLHKTLRARVSRDKLSTVCLVTDVQLLPTSSRELLHRDKELPPNKQHFSFHPLQLNTCSAWLGLPSQSWSSTSALLNCPCPSASQGHCCGTCSPPLL